MPPTHATPGTDRDRAPALYRMGRWCHDRRRTVAVAWVGGIVLLGLLVGLVGSSFGAGFETPDSDGSDGFDLIDTWFGGQGSGVPGSVVFRADAGVESPEVREPMSAIFAAMDAVEGVNVTSPYDERAFGQISPDGTVAFAEIDVPRDLSDTAISELGPELKALAPAVEGVDIEFGKELFIEFEPPESEVLGLAFAIFILIAAFGSVVAMGLPIGTALAGIASGTLVVTLLSNVLEMPEFTSTLGIMIGLGVGIDYALFIVTRYRDELHAGRTPSEATGVAMDTAGRAVLFAGTTVVISLLGLLLIGLDFVQGLGIGASLTVLVTMISSVTLLPALLGFVGERVEVTRMRGLVAASLVALTLVSIGFGQNRLAPVFGLIALVVLVVGRWVPGLRDVLPARTVRPVEQTLPYRWSRYVQRHPLAMALLGTGLLMLLAIPAFSLRLGFSDEGNFPEDTTSRRAYDMLAEGFGPGFNGPLLLVAELPVAADGGAGPAGGDLQAITAALAEVPGVDQVTPPFPNDPERPQAVLWRVYPTTSPQDAATADLVDAIRSSDLLAAAEANGLDIKVTGSVAISNDFSSYLAKRIPVFFGAVLLLSFLLLLAVFRSVLVALKAVIMNLLSIGASYGLVVAVFQWGWMSELIGIGRGGPIEPFIPMMLFAIVFGLSMDYEVFLLSRVREEYNRTGDNARAVADGLASTARVITAAAAIMVFVFGSFLLETDRIIKLFGFGLSSAILLDATVVRLLLVPATMELLGERNWWLPKWLDRILPDIDVEGHDVPRDSVGPRHDQIGPDPATSDDDLGEKVLV